MLSQITKIRKICENLDVDAIALVPGPNFTQIFGKPFESDERPFVVIVPRSEPAVAIVPDIEKSSWSLLNFEGDTIYWRDQTGYMTAFHALSEKISIKRLSVEGQVMRVFVYQALKAVFDDIEIADANARISSLREIKSVTDLNAMKHAIEISETALKKTLQEVRIGQTETELQSVLIQNLFTSGADQLSFWPMVAAGEGSAIAHALPRPDRKICKGDILLLDFGVYKQGFASDITRTVFVGEPSDEAKDVYETVLQANRIGRQMASPELTAHQVDDAVIGFLENTRYSNWIRGKTGHGIGRELHEAPQIMRGNHHQLMPGMTFTIEPGLYHAGKFGIRIEDTVLVTETGNVTLTNFPRDILILDP